MFFQIINGQEQLVYGKEPAGPGQNQLVLYHKSRPKSENSYRGRGFFILGFRDEISGYYHRKKKQDCLVLLGIFLACLSI